MWKTTKLGEVCKIFSGNSINAEVKKDRYTNVTNGTHYIATKDVSFDGKINYDNGVSIPKHDENKFRKAEPETVFVCAEGGSAGRKIAFSNKECFFVNKLCALKAGDELLPKYVYYFTLGDSFQNQFKDALTGIIGGVSLSKIKNFTIKFPTIIKEQKAIVTKLDAEFAEIDKAIATVKKQIDNVHSLILNEIETTFVCNSKDWTELTVSNVGKVQTGKTPKTNDADNYGDFIPFIKPPHFNTDGTLNTIDKGLSEKGLAISCLMPNNSIMMVCIGATIGKVGINDVDVSSNQQINSLTPKPAFDPKFIYWQMRSKRFQADVISKSGMTTLPIINKSKWEGLLLNFPNSLDEQQSISRRLSELNGWAEAYQNLCKCKLEELDKLKSAILAQELQSEEVA